jgi:hypothetical protein
VIKSRTCDGERILHHPSRPNLTQKVFVRQEDQNRRRSDKGIRGQSKASDEWELNQGMKTAYNAEKGKKKNSLEISLREQSPASTLTSKIV